MMTFSVVKPRDFGPSVETTARILPWKSPAPSTAQRSDELTLLQLSLAAQALDALAECGHATSSDAEPRSPSPATAATARATKTRVTFLRYGWLKSVLSRGFAGPAARSATLAMSSRVTRWPTSAAA